MENQSSQNIAGQNKRDLNSNAPGATSVWVGGHPALDPTQTSAQLPVHARNGSTGQSYSRQGSEDSGGDDRRFIVVSVRDSTSDSEPNSRKSSTNVPPSPSAVQWSSASEASPGHHSRSGSESSNPFSPAPPVPPPPPLPSAAAPASAGPVPNVTQFFPNPYLQTTPLAGNTANILSSYPSILTSNGNILPNNANTLASNANILPNNGNVLAGNANILPNNGNILTGNASNVLRSTGTLYNGGTFLPAATSSMTMLPQTSYDPNALLLQQQYALSSELLAASLAQTLSLSQVPPMQVPPQPQVSMPHLGHSFEVLSAAVAANQAMLSPTLQSPTSPTFQLPGAVNHQHVATTAGLPPSLTGISAVDSPVNLHDEFLTESPLGKKESCFDGGTGTSTDVCDHSHSLQSSASLDNGDTTSGVGSSVPSSPSESLPTSPHCDLHLMTSGDESHFHDVMVEPRYDRPSDKTACMKCGKKVYAVEKLGPVKDVLYHKTCFTCAVCHTVLTLKSFHHNEADLNDLNVYCGSHKPIARANPLDANSVGIHRALTVPRHGRVNEQIRGGPDAGKNTHLDSRSVSIRAAMHAPAPDLQASIKHREGAWFREQRKSENMPPVDVVRHNEKKYEGSKSLYSNSG